MSDRIEVPPNLSGDEQQQLQQMWRYLYQLSEALNNNLQAIGGNDLTDDERKIMQKVIGEGAEQGMSEMETLKSLIIKTADFVQTSLNEYSLHLIGSSVASGQFGKYVRNTKLDVAVNPEGITQKYKFQEVVQGLKTFSINAKNYIKTGLLRTVNNVPVYGVAIGKDVVTFDENGNETYVDGNKVAELTAEELSFWQNGVKIAGYTGSRISFYYGGVEVFYIQNGKIYAAQDLEIGSGNKIVIGNWTFNEEGMDKVRGDDDPQIITRKIHIGDKTTNYDYFNAYVSMEAEKKLNGQDVLGKLSLRVLVYEPNSPYIPNNYEGIILEPIIAPGYSGIYATNLRPTRLRGVLGHPEYPWSQFYVNYIVGEDSYDNGDGLLQIYLNPDHGTNLFSCSKMTIEEATDPIDNQKVVCVYGKHKDSTYSKIDVDCHTVRYDNLVQFSSREVKEDIAELKNEGDAIDKLRPVSFRYKEANIRKHFGLIHEETMGILPEICIGDMDTPAEERGINYMELVPMLLKEIQDLRKRVAALEEKVKGDE